METTEKKSDAVRRMLLGSAKPKEIAELLGVTPNYVYSIKYYDQKKAAKANKPQRKRGRPRKVKVVQQPYTPVESATYPVYVEIPVPQPFSHYTFWQRLRILFLGRTA